MIGEHLREVERALQATRAAQSRLNDPRFREDRRHDEALLDQELLRAESHTRAAEEEANRI